MAISDPAIKEWVDVHAAMLHTIAPIFCAAFVIGTGKILERVQLRRRAAALSAS
jgi:hypothetical protein